MVDLNPTKGSEITKTRPCVIIGIDPINKARRTVVIIPLSSQGKERPPLAISVKCMKKKVIAVCDQIRAIDKSRVHEFADELSDEDMEKISLGLGKVIGLY